MFKEGRARLWGSGMVILNIIRALNVITLLTVSASSWIMIVMSGLTGYFSFFDAVSHFFTFMLATFLVVSECGVLQGYFRLVWPALAEDHGFFWLGASMIMLGCGVMADTTKPAYYTNNIGMPLWRFILAAGILSITLGAFNIIATLVFQDRGQKITARMVRANGSLTHAPENPQDYYSYRTGGGSNVGGSGGSSNHSLRHDEKEPAGTKNWAKRATALFAAKRNKLEISNPIPHHDDYHSPAPQPPAGIHPAYRRGGADDSGSEPHKFDARRYTNYSTSSRLSQFSEPPPMPTGPHMV